MNIICIIVLLTSTSVTITNTLQIRENQNVLVPNNDVNIHDKIKTLLTEDDFDPNELNNVNDIIKFDRFYSPIAEKMILETNTVQSVKNLDELDSSVDEDSSSVYGDSSNDDDDDDNNDNEIVDGESINQVPTVTMMTFSWSKMGRTQVTTTQNFMNFSEAIEYENGTDTESTSYTTDFYNTTELPTTPNHNSNFTDFNYTTTSHEVFTTPSYNNTTTYSYQYASTTYSFNQTTTSNYLNFTTRYENLTTTTTSPHQNYTTQITTLSNNNTTNSTDIPGYTFLTSTPAQNATDYTTEIITTTPNMTSFTTTTTTSWSRTTNSPQLNPTEQEDCILGKASDILKWIDNSGVLQMEFIMNDDSMKILKIEDFSYQEDKDLSQVEDVGVLSLAYIDIEELPYSLFNRSKMTLQYLSLAGNEFDDLTMADEIDLPNLYQLDMRYCELTTIGPRLLSKLKKLECLFVSNNNIILLLDNSLDLPSLFHLDLSSNKDSIDSDESEVPSPLKLSTNVFDKMKNLEFLDLSHTKIETKSISALGRLPSALVGISLCYTEISATSDNFLSNLTQLKYLDLSGNPQLNLTKNMFSEISMTLERLDAKDSNIKTLEWTHPLTKLKALNLKDNKLKIVDNNSFSHMLLLEDLNLSKNSIGNWYTHLFSQNQRLQTLNFRENTLTLLTDEMKDDLKSVRHLALGLNEFECHCNLRDFMHDLFEATKNANLSKIEAALDIITSTLKPSPSDDDMTTIQPIFLGMRNNLHPRYDIISRTYQKYYDQILRSIEALKKNNYTRKSKSFVSISDAIMSAYLSDEFQTVLLDYDENNRDYQCMNITGREKQSMLDLIEMCDEESSSKNPPYLSDNDFIIMALATSIPVVIIIAALIFVMYWKWWYIRYFFVLCKNSAILSFMDDNDDDKEVIVRRKSDSSIEIFLFDVFVSYSDHNRSWVLDEFIPNIEKRESINVCLHERDFTVGYPILENIVSCMDRSRCLLLLVSENFLQSQWCQFEMNLAQHRLLETRKEKLILVFLEDIPVRKQTKTLKYLMRTKTYIKWPENGSKDDKQLFWKRLKKSIISSKWEHDSYSSTA